MTGVGELPRLVLACGGAEKRRRRRRGRQQRKRGECSHGVGEGSDWEGCCFVRGRGLIGGGWGRATCDSRREGGGWVMGWTVGNRCSGGGGVGVMVVVGVEWRGLWQQRSHRSARLHKGLWGGRGGEKGGWGLQGSFFFFLKPGPGCSISFWDTFSTLTVVTHLNLDPSITWDPRSPVQKWFLTQLMCTRARGM